jgi:NADH-quinone oxidoreductase subunit J
MVESILFGLFTITAIACALGTVFHRNPVHCALFLVGVLLSMSGMFVLLNAQFIAAIQILVYAGAIMVLFLFVVMLLNAHREDEVDAGARPVRGPLRAGAVLAVVLVAELGWALVRAGRTRDGALSAGAGADPAALQSVRTLGNVLFTEYSLAFEVTSILIIVAMIGAVILAKRES